MHPPLRVRLAFRSRVTVNVFDQLSDKLDGILSGLRQRGVLTEPMIREGLLEDGAYYFRIARGYLAGDTRLLGLEADLRATQAEAAASEESRRELRAAARELYGRLLELDPGSAYLKRKLDALR